VPPVKKTAPQQPSPLAGAQGSQGSVPAGSQGFQGFVTSSIFSQLVQANTAKAADPMGDEAVADSQSNRALKESYARFWKWATLAQVLIADGLFLMYAWRGEHWKIQPQVMEFWLSATVIQIVGVVLVITHNLFPTPPNKPGRRKGD
jgi:hypothetical protein